MGYVWEEEKKKTRAGYSSEISYLVGLQEREHVVGVKHNKWKDVFGSREIYY